jgi:predicted nucleic acid-binding protein
MLKKLKIYIDTSALGYLDEHESPNDMNVMLGLWENIKNSKYDVIISELTFTELNDNKDIGKVNTLLSYIAQIEYETIGITAEAEYIADLVKKNELLISDKHYNDRLHIGCAFG